MNSSKEQLERRETSWLCWLLASVVALWVLAASTTCSEGQVVIRRKLVPAQPVQQLAFGPVEDDDSVVDFEAGAVLKTDPDLEGVLEKAVRFREDGNYPVACKLWQAVLNQSGDSLYSSNGETYFSLVEQVERTLAELPAEGLAAYRVLADGAAKEIIAASGSKLDESALSQVVRQYFVSSVGDEAAFRLGCIYLDRFDFIGARRMFEKVVNRYPDPSISLDEYYTRIALCQSYLGDLEAAKESIRQAEAIKANAPGVDLIKRTLGKLASDDIRQSFGREWLLPLGDVRRYGVTAGLPDELMEGDLEAQWQFYFEPKDKYLKRADTAGRLLSGNNANNDVVEDTKNPQEDRLIKSWRDKTWRPVGELLIHAGKVFFKTGTDLTAWDIAEAKSVSQMNLSRSKTAPDLSWRSLWSTAFEIDEATRMMQLIRRSYGAFSNRGGSRGSSSRIPTPNSQSEIQFFGDGITQQMSIVDGVVYTIEGKIFNLSGKNNVSQSQVRPQWNSTYRRSRSNFLTAYDANSGKVLWRLPRQLESDQTPEFSPEETESPWLSSGGFMAAPIEFGGKLIAPVNLSGAISVYAFDPKNEGKTVWKSFLCDEPESGAVPWSAINLSIDGSDLFVNCGMGVIFILDPATGLVRFAKRYERVGKADDFRRRNNWTVNRLNFSGWSSDMVIPYGRQMICLCSDSDSIQSFDRNTGELLWKNGIRTHGFKVDYLLGVYGDLLYAAGPETIVAYDLSGEGRMAWGAEQTFEGKLSYGRGLLTPKGIYMPVEDGIYLYDLKGDRGLPKILKKVHVELGTDGPVGNLFSDGQTFWVHGANRLFLLGRRSGS